MPALITICLISQIHYNLTALGVACDCLVRDS